MFSPETTPPSPTTMPQRIAASLAVQAREFLHAELGLGLAGVLLLVLARQDYYLLAWVGGIAGGCSYIGLSAWSTSWLLGASHASGPAIGWGLGAILLRWFGLGTLVVCLSQTGSGESLILDPGKAIVALGACFGYNLVMLLVWALRGVWGERHQRT